MAYWEPEQWVAGGNIHISRFVKIDTGNDHTLLQAGANELSYGISAVGPKSPPGLSGTDSSLCASANDNFQVYPPMSIALITCAATLNSGTFVKPDANGMAVAASANDNAAAILKQAGANQLTVLCKVLAPGAKAS